MEFASPRPEGVRLVYCPPLLTVSPPLDMPQESSGVPLVVMGTALDGGPAEGHRDSSWARLFKTHLLNFVETHVPAATRWYWGYRERRQLHKAAKAIAASIDMEVARAESYAQKQRTGKCSSNLHNRIRRNQWIVGRNHKHLLRIAAQEAVDGGAEIPVPRAVNAIEPERPAAAAGPVAETQPSSLAWLVQHLQQQQCTRRQTPKEIGEQVLLHLANRAAGQQQQLLQLAYEELRRQYAQQRIRYAFSSCTLH